MTEIITCQILNEINQESITLYVEWHESYFEIILLNLNEQPLKGEMSTKDISYFSEELSKSRDEYLQETKNAFFRKNAEIQFFMKDSIFEWKRNNVWTLGRITLSPIEDISIVSKTLQQVLNSYKIIREKLAVLEAENQNLRSIKLRLTSDIEDMIRVKTSMEKDLYKKFLFILNSKKERIRELQKSLKEKANKDSLFDAPTDEDSAEETETKKQIQLDIDKCKLNKRKSNDKDSYGKVQKCVHTELETNHVHDSEREMSPKASTSKDCIDKDTTVKHNIISENENVSPSKEDNSKPKNFNSRISFIEDESEDDLFSE